MRLIRSALFNLWFYGMTTVMASLGIVVRHRPWPAVVAFAQLWARLALGGLRVLCGVRWKVEGAENLTGAGPAVIASMHQSAFDTLVWTLLVPAYCYVLKRELTQVPLFGPLLIASGMIPVDRGAGFSAMRGLLRGTDRAIAQSRQIVIFPEGTRVAPGQHVPLLPGVAAIAARSGLPVIPVVTNSGLFWGRKSFWKQPGTIIIRILPALPVGLERDALMAAIESAFRDGAAHLPGPVDNSVGGVR